VTSLLHNDLQAQFNAFVAYSNVAVSNTREAEYFAYLLFTEGTRPGHRKDHLAWQAQQAHATSQNPAIPPPQNARKRLRLTVCFFMTILENRRTNYQMYSVGWHRREHGPCQSRPIAGVREHSRIFTTIQKKVLKLRKKFLSVQADSIYDSSNP
jgi:hypothetical protein